MKAFHAYFKKQWMESEFCNWQIYQTPPGFTTTNNPIESYNGMLKAFFTNRLKLNLVPPLEISNFNFQQSIYQIKHALVLIQLIKVYACT